LAKQRLLVTGRDDSTGEETIEVAHEALIQHWSRLRQWLDEDRDFLIWLERLKGALGEWQRTGHDADVLLRGAPLAEAERWYGERQQDLGREECAFIEHSVSSRNRKRRFIRMGITFAVITALAVAFWQYTEAERLRAARRPINPEMVDIPAGKFEMGASKDDREALVSERPVREVVIARPFKIGKYEVTFDEYDKFSLATDRRPPSDQGFGGGTRPVINVSWDDAVAYAKWLSDQTGKRYRLPTESEWEYVARAGTLTSRYWGDESNDACAHANVYDATGAKIGPSKYGFTFNPHQCDDRFTETAPVGKFRPNEFGLHDMLGNVWEWVQDCWHESYAGAPVDGTAWGKDGGGNCGQRVMRGGSWYSGPEFLRSSFRTRDFADDRYGIIGFRLAQDRP
jgi:formylglycine-generating enzyme required for sulfatase activity